MAQSTIDVEEVAMTIEYSAFSILFFFTHRLVARDMVQASLSFVVTYLQLVYCIYSHRENDIIIFDPLKHVKSTTRL